MSTIGELARASGVHLETIRYYERIGLMPHPARTSGGHRAYDDQHLQRLRFIRRARELGFTLDQIRELLSLSEKAGQPCNAVVEIANAHLEEIRRKIADLARLERILSEAVSRCAATAVGPDCAVLQMLSQ